MSAPDSIRVNVNNLQIGEAIHVKDLQLPENVKALLDPDDVVVRVVARAEEPEEAKAGEQAEPEIIGKDKDEDGPAEDK